jgi:hemerythrin
MFTWKDELIVGLKEIDDEHKELFSLFQSLSADISADKDMPIIESAVVYLDDYTKGHFEREERYMKDLKYPAQEDHKKEHKKFAKDFSKLKTHMRKNGNASLWSLHLEGFVRDWFVSHIQKTDKKLADFLCKKLKKTTVKAK